MAAVASTDLGTSTLLPLAWKSIYVGQVANRLLEQILGL
jgi:hypothetical protein